MNEDILFGLAMIVPGVLLGMVIDTARVAWRQRKARRQECRRPQGVARRQECRLSGGAGHA